MRDMIGCAGFIAAVPFIFGIIGSLFATEANLVERLMIALMPAAFVFVAALILFARDRGRHALTKRAVRRMLLARNDVNDSDFFAHFPDADSKLMAQIRQAISLFFECPSGKFTRPIGSTKTFDSVSSNPPFISLCYAMSLTPAASHHNRLRSKLRTWPISVTWPKRFSAYLTDLILQSRETAV